MCRTLISASLKKSKFSGLASAKPRGSKFFELGSGPSAPRNLEFKGRKDGMKVWMGTQQIGLHTVFCGLESQVVEKWLQMMKLETLSLHLPRVIASGVYA